jgi:O-antigen ligase
LNVFAITNSYYQNSISPFFNFIALSISILIMFTFFVTTINYKETEKIIVFIMIFSLVIGLLGILFGSSRDIEGVIEGYTREIGFSWQRFVGLFANPNALGRFYALTYILTLLYIFEVRKAQLVKVLAISVLFMSIVMIIASNSRSALLIIVVFTFIYFFAKNNVSLKEKILLLLNPKFIVPIILSITAVVFLASEGIINTYEKFLKASGEEGDMGWTSWRMQLWVDAVNTYVFTGNQNFKEFLDTCTLLYARGADCGVHNNYIHQALKFGILPAFTYLILMLYFLFTSYFSYKRFNSFNAIVSFSCAIYLLIFYIFETGTAFTPFWMMIIFWSINYAERRNEKNN